MKNVLGLILCTLFFAITASSQTNRSTVTKTVVIPFGMGGTVTLIGAERGDVSIESWEKTDVEIVAVVENEAADILTLEKMRTVNGFVTEEGLGRIIVSTASIRDKAVLKKLGVKLGKESESAKFSISYSIKVPRYTGLIVNGGIGDLKIKGVDGDIRINFLEGDAEVSLVGGTLDAVIGSGNLTVSINTRGWRGRAVSAQIARGTLNAILPSNLDAELEASVENGRIENSFRNLKPKARTEFSERSIVGITGNGGVPVRLNVASGKILISEKPSAP